MEPFLGQIMLWSVPFEPRGWAFCDGRLLPINQYQALYALLGNRYGGSMSSNNFALPDLRGKTPRGWQAPEQLGASGGAETVTLVAANLPPHSHSLNAYTEQGNHSDPTNRLLANTNYGTTIDNDYAPSGAMVQLAAGAVTGGGNGAAVSVMQPSLGVNYIIALQGIFPSRA